MIFDAGVALIINVSSNKSHSIKLERIMTVPITLVCVIELLIWERTIYLPFTHYSLLNFLMDKKT